MSFISYLKFLIKSTNQHGVHSPFIYNFVTRGLYNKQLVKPREFANYPAMMSRKQFISLLKIIRYLEVKAIFTDEKELSINDLIFINYLKENLDFYLNYMHNDSILIINNIHQKENELLWRKLIENEKVTACIDVYYQGYIFIRREQPKEVFYIR